MVCKALNIDNTRAHRAASDALATAEVLLKLAPQIVA
jgi:DNA polymerase III epsilon subunit-like protein